MGGTDTPYVASAVNHHIDRIIEENKLQKEVEVATQLKSKFYVEDLIAGFNLIVTACHFRETASKIFTDIEMKLTKLTSNTPEVLNTIPDDEKAPVQPKDFEIELEDNNYVSKPTKMVELNWYPKEDVFPFEPFKNWKLTR